MNDTIPALLGVLQLSERLKFELRHSWLSNGRRESVAEHSWQMALMAMLLHPHLAHPVDLGQTLQMVLIHDLVEAEAGDIPYFETGSRKEAKAAREAAAAARLREMIPAPTGQVVFDLWHAFEAGQTPEARFARALDSLEVQIQHNLAGPATWEAVEFGLVYNKMDGPCAHDAFLAAFCEAVKGQAEDAMAAAGLDVAALRAAALAPSTGE